MNRILVSLAIGVFALSAVFAAVTKGPVKDLKMQKLQKSRPTVMASQWYSLNSVWGPRAGIIFWDASLILGYKSYI